MAAVTEPLALDKTLEGVRQAILALPSGNAAVIITGTTPTIIAEANKRYICGEVATLSLMPPASGICDVVFTSGATATVLTVPSSVIWANGFDPASLDADTTYELNIMDGLGVAASWT